ncbi:MAG TPA: hypothetical protein VHE12_02805 [bacterium]|nr:hypothetical protein [bacterium]
MIKRSIASWSLALAGFLVLAFWEGCGPPPKPIPPAFSLYGYKGMAVVPFINQSSDPELASALAEEMTDEVAGLNALPIVQASQVAAFLRSQKATPSDLLTNDGLRRALQTRFKCDLLMMGTALAYSEVLKDEAPVRKSLDNGRAEWGFTTRRKAIVDASFKILDPATGNLLWSQKNQGYSWRNTWNPLPIPGEIAIPSEIDRFIHLADLVRHRVTKDGDEEPLAVTENDHNTLIYPKSQAFRDLRQNAVHQTVYDIAEDFRGHRGWVPNGSNP